MSSGKMLKILDRGVVRLREGADTKPVAVDQLMILSGSRLKNIIIILELKKVRITRIFLNNLIL